MANLARWHSWRRRAMSSSDVTPYAPSRCRPTRRFASARVHATHTRAAASGATSRLGCGRWRAMRARMARARRSSPPSTRCPSSQSRPSSTRSSPAYATAMARRACGPTPRTRKCRRSSAMCSARRSHAARRSRHDGVRRCATSPHRSSRCATPCASGRLATRPIRNSPFVAASRTVVRTARSMRKWPSSRNANATPANATAPLANSCNSPSDCANVLREVVDAYGRSFPYNTSKLHACSQHATLSRLPSHNASAIAHQFVSSCNGTWWSPWEADAALGAEAEVFGHARQIVVRDFGFEERHQEGRDGMSLEAGVHRSHEDAVGEGADVRAEGQRFEHARKVRGRFCGCIGIIA